MDVADKLNRELLAQAFAEEQKHYDRLEQCRNIAAMYAQVENAVAVLSDMKTQTSYVYYGGAAEKLGLSRRGDSTTIASIWEEEIFRRIHPDDLPEKHLRELCFFHFLNRIPNDKRVDYYLTSTVRIRDASGVYIPVQHRMFYIASHSNGSIRLALCLYALAVGVPGDSLIVDSTDGVSFELAQQKCNDLLSAREKEVLRMIDRGQASKEIARLLSISVNTVNRHRQNILERLQVGNSIEACRIAKELGLI